MTKKEFTKKITHEKKDLLQEFIRILEKKKIPFCVIGGLAVNAYAEPVVSLDFDVVIAAERLGDALDALREKFKITRFPNSLNLSSPLSDLRIQIQIDARYQNFIRHAAVRDVLGYKVPVAAMEDILQGKIWAAMDEKRRASKRQKDMADILRLIEKKSSLISRIPPALKRKLSL